MFIASCILNISMIYLQIVVNRLMKWCCVFNFEVYGAKPRSMIYILVWEIFSNQSLRYWTSEWISSPEFERVTTECNFSWSDYWIVTETEMLQIWDIEISYWTMRHFGVSFSTKTFWFLILSNVEIDPNKFTILRKIMTYGKHRSFQNYLLKSVICADFIPE